MPDLSPSQVLQGSSATDGQKRRRANGGKRGGGWVETSDRLQKRRPGGVEDRKNMKQYCKTSSGAIYIW